MVVLGVLLPHTYISPGDTPESGEFSADRSVLSSFEAVLRTDPSAEGVLPPLKRYQRSPPTVRKILEPAGRAFMAIPKTTKRVVWGSARSDGLRPHPLWWAPSHTTC